MDASFKPKGLFPAYTAHELRAMLRETLSDELRAKIEGEILRRETPTAGQIAYEEDCRREPKYPCGTARKAWKELDHIARQSWELNPTVRAKA